MKICFICPEYPEGPHGGIGTMVQILSRELVKNGHEVRVIGIYPHSYPAPDFEEDHMVKVWRLRVMKGKFGWVLPFITQYKIIKKWVEEKEIDIVEAPDSRGWFAFWPKLAIPLIIRAHGSNTFIANVLGKKPNLLTTFMERQSYRRADALLSVSNFSAKTTSQVFSLKKEFTIIYNGLEAPDFSDILEREANRIIFSGSLNRNKGVFNLIEAFCILLDRIPKATLELYGKDTKDSEVGSVKMHIIKTIPKDKIEKIKFMGHVSRIELFHVYRTATLAIFPSFVESFSMAPMESMVCGCPTIYSEIGSGPEIIENEVDGILVNPRDSEDIANSLEKILNNPFLAEKISKNGIIKIKNQFSQTLMMEKTIAFYRAITSKPLA